MFIAIRLRTYTKHCLNSSLFLFAVYYYMEIIYLINGLSMNLSSAVYAHMFITVPVYAMTAKLLLLYITTDILSTYLYSVLHILKIDHLPKWTTQVHFHELLI